ncbi:MAG: LLM class flavin-dependent oxidoreductase [Chloroflexi bacterium]|nr:LLM class flavin-dependent oxidoreductase [Chloroflexota bacterium]
MIDLATSLGRLGAWGHLDTLAAPDLHAYAQRIAELGYGALWVPETVGREPFALLGAISTDVGSMWLGTSIASIWARDPMAARMGAQTLHELTGGRFVLGLGVSHPHLAQKLRGHTYDRPLTRMREYLEAYRRMPYMGPRLPGEASPTEPSILLAALRERMLGLSATAADGAFPYLVTPERIAWMRGILDAATTGTTDTADGIAADGAGDVDVVRPEGRPLLAVTLAVVLGDATAARAAARAYLVPYLRAPNYQASWEAQGFAAADWEQPGSDRLIDAMIAWGTETDIRTRIDELHAAGADHVAIIPLQPDGTTQHLATLEALAPAR